MAKTNCLILVTSIAFILLALSGCTQPEAKMNPKEVNVCFIPTSAAPYAKNMTTAEYMSSNYGDAYGFLLDGIRAQNYTVKVLENYYNLSGCNLVLSLKIEDSQSTSDAIRNFACSGGKVFVLWPGGSTLVTGLEMNLTETVGLPIISFYPSHQAAKEVSKVYIPGIQGFVNGNMIVPKGGDAVIAEKTCNSGVVIFSASNAFDNNNIAKFDNAKLGLQIVKYLANDSSPVVVPVSSNPENENVLYYRTVGSVGDALSEISKDPGAKDKVVIGWWDYGTTIESYGMKAIADSASPAALETMAIYSDVPSSLKYQITSELGYNFSSDNAIENLANLYATTNDIEGLYSIKRNNASYILFSSDLEERFASLAYLYCYFKNETEPSTISGSSCEKQLNIEVMAMEKNPEACEIPGKVAVKAVSLYNIMAGIRKYCVEFGTGSDSNSIALYSENGTRIDAEVKSSGIYSEKNYYFNVYYPSNSTEKRGNFYDTIFYKGLYETLPASMNATLVYNKTIDGMLTKVYRVD